MKRHPCPAIKFVVHPGAEPWAPDQATLDKLACMLSQDVLVELVHRRDLPAIWQRDHGGKAMPAKSHAFRAYARGKRTVIFVDDTETPTSVMWLLLHELAHVDLPRSRLLAVAYRNMKRPVRYLTDDAAHESHPEERLANEVATAVMPRLGLPAVQCDRMWWRRRMR